MLKMNSQKAEKNYASSNQLYIPSYQDLLESTKKHSLFPASQTEKTEEFERKTSEDPAQVDQAVRKDVSLDKENNNENAKSLTQENINDSTRDIKCVSPVENIKEGIEKNLPQTPWRNTNKEFKPKTPVPSISVVPPSDEKSLNTQKKEIVNTEETEAMTGYTDEEIRISESNANNIPHYTDISNDMEVKNSDTGNEETADSVNKRSSNNTMKETLQSHNRDLGNNSIQPQEKGDFQKNLCPANYTRLDRNELKKLTKGRSKSKQEEDLNNYDMVIERDGRFDVVTPDDMNALANRMKKLPVSSGRKQSPKKDKRKQQEVNNNRPLTAYTNSTPSSLDILKNRPYSTSYPYYSPYALTAKQKEAVRKKLLLVQEKVRKAIQAEREKEEENKRINKIAFECWLNQANEKEEMAQRKKSKLLQEMDRNKKEKAERLQKQNEIHRKWVQKKYKQIKHEELLRKRQQEESESVKKCRSPEEIESAYQRWLQSKHIEKKKQKYLTRQKNWFHHRLSNRSKLIKNMTWNLRLSNSFRYKEPRNLNLKLK